MPVWLARCSYRTEWAVGRAIALDDKLAEAHDAVAANKLFFDWDWAAERELRRTLELNPNFADARGSRGLRFVLVQSSGLVGRPTVAHRARVGL